MGGKIRMDLKEIATNTRNRSVSVQDKDCWRVIVNAPLNFRVP